MYYLPNWITKKLRILIFSYISNKDKNEHTRSIFYLNKISLFRFIKQLRHVKERVNLVQDIVGAVGYGTD